MIHIINTRLIDVFLTGPLQIYISTFVKTPFLKYFMLITGLINIIFNGHNYLLMEKRIIKKPVYVLQPFISKNGKYQIHRLYNLLIMYPIFLYIALYIKLPYYLRFLFVCNIIFGSLYNLYYFLNIQYKKENVFYEKFKGILV